MRRFAKFLSCALCASVLMLTGCAAPEQNTGQIGGTVVGAGLGAFLGNTLGGGVLGTVLGAAVGGLIGNRIGAALDDASRQRHEATVRQVVDHPEAGQQDWQLAQQGTSGSVTPLRSFNQDGRQCTEVQSTVYSKGQTVTDTNSYCKQPDGSVTLLN